MTRHVTELRLESSNSWSEEEVWAVFSREYWDMYMVFKWIVEATLRNAKIILSRLPLAQYRQCIFFLIDHGSYELTYYWIENAQACHYPGEGLERELNSALDSWQFIPMGQSKQWEVINLISDAYDRKTHCFRSRKSRKLTLDQLFRDDASYLSYLARDIRDDLLGGFLVEI